MPEEDGKIFGEAYQLYDKWRGTRIERPEQWLHLTEELHGFVCRHPESRLALRLAIGLMDTIDDLYHDGQAPAVPDYIGRADL
jgi:hypothetical protein